MAFIAALRREWVRRNPTEPYCPVPAWSAIEPPDQRLFVKCMIVALAATDPANVQRVIGEELSRDS